MSGSSLPNFLEIAKKHHIDPAHRGRYIRSLLVSAILHPFGLWENWRWKKRIAAYELGEEPVFILGHWRSGTTLLHNLMSQNDHFGYCNTFQSVFPHLLLSHQDWLEPILNPFLPKTRPSDNVAFNFRHPQEEEVGLGNVQPYSFYNAWYFPKDFGKLYHQHILQDTVTEAELTRWKVEYLTFIKKAMIKTGGTQFLSKNPTHTARVPLLLELFPKAKFVFLYRNPYTVFESTRKFVRATIPPLRFQDFEPKDLDRSLLKLYKTLVDKYEQDKVLIPQGNLVEVSFEDLEADKIGTLRHIYQGLGLTGFSESLPVFKEFLQQRKSYKKNAYSYDPLTIELVEKYLPHVLDRWGYQREVAA